MGKRNFEIGHRLLLDRVWVVSSCVLCIRVFVASCLLSWTLGCVPGSCRAVTSTAILACQFSEKRGRDAGIARQRGEVMQHNALRARASHLIVSIDTRVGIYIFCTL